MYSDESKNRSTQFSKHDASDLLNFELIEPVMHLYVTQNIVNQLSPADI